jgi:hypothetical protein
MCENVIFTSTIVKNSMKEDSYSKKSSRAIKHRLGLNKASSQILETSSPTPTFSSTKKYSVVENEFTKEHIIDTNREKSRFNCDHITLTVESRLPPMAGFGKKSSKRVPNQYYG